MGRRLTSTAVFAVALMLASCGEEGSPGIGEGGGGDSEETTEGPEEVALPAGGPTDPMFPADDDAYDLLAAGQCQELKEAAERWPAEVAAQHGADAVELYRSAAHVCLGEWDPAIEAFDRIGTPELEGSCPRDVVYDWLKPLIEARKADPSFEPEILRSEGSSRCPDGEDEDGDEPTVGPSP
ncbi:MAG TPA: hypothetical protein VFA00_00585 [Actinomycetota bacterium]|jgi:hypothetical protein|nr:hypothetical protein [Actinomycetota bacterium]